MVNGGKGLVKSEILGKELKFEKLVGQRAIKPRRKKR